MMFDISKMLEPISAEEFRSSYFNQSSVHIPGQPGKFADLLGWEAINGIINTSILPDPDILLVRERQFIEFKSVGELRKAINEGYTLIINNFHKRHLAVGALAESAGSFFGESCQVNMYLSHPEFPGFDLHYDTHDVLVFQVFGQKNWQIHLPTIERPTVLLKSSEQPCPTTVPYMNVVTTEGDLLYIPRGHWHIARPTAAEPSLHLTLGILSRTGLDFLEWLKSELSDDVLWRDSFTFQPDAYAEKLVASIVGTMSSSEIFDKYRRYCAMNIWRPNRLDLPLAYSRIEKFALSNQTVHIPLPVPVIKEEAQSYITLIFGNRKVNLRKEACALVDHLLAGNDVDLSRLPSYPFGITERQTLATIRALYDLELLHVKSH
jgi:hypothetical protein